MKKYPNDLIGDIMKAFGKYADRPAFVIEDTACTYGELATCVQKISSLFKDREDKIIGIVAENRLETYASIPVSYTHLRAHETGRNLVCRLLLEKKKTKQDKQ